jgi:hypothetical protein
MDYVLKIVWWWLASIVKFLFTPFVMMSNPGSEQWSWLEIILITSSGAALGCYLFFHFGEFIMKKWMHFFPPKKPKRIFTSTRRRIIHLKMRFGIRGLMLISGLISVPVTAILTARYYKHDNSALSKIIIGFFLWSVALTSLAYSFRLIAQ